MAFTDNCDLFGSIHEDGINLVVRHVMRQRPSLFNYATAFFVENPDRLCERIEAAKAVRDAGNPLFTIQDPIPVLGTPIPVGLNWCLQLTDLQIDFHPGNVFGLPPELGTLAPQRLAMRAKACLGLDCPPDGLIADLIPRIEILSASKRGPRLSHGDLKPDDSKEETLVLPTRELLCFCLELFIVAHVEWGTIGSAEQQWLKIRLDGLEIVDLRPTQMEDMIECYARTVLRLGILPRLSTPMEAMVLNITDMLKEQGLTIGEEVTLQPTAISTAVPNNPAVEDDQLKAFISLIVTEV